MRFHVISEPHTQTTKAYSTCAYTQKVRKFCNMMKARGHEVLLYASEENEADVSELITCITKTDQASFGFNGPEDYLKVKFDPEYPIWPVFNQSVIQHMATRIQPKDFICIITSYPVKPIADTFPSNMTVEFGIGYDYVFAEFRVFESYAWMHAMYGKDNKTDGRWQDAVIPNYFEVEDFPFSAKKEDYYLFIGRLIDRKGWRIAQQVCKKLGKRLVVAGQGEFSGYGEYVGVVGPKERGRLMSRATAVFAPTIYIGPFEGVSAEANLCGTPVITTDWGSFTENVIEGLNGYRCRTLKEFIEATEKVKKLDPAQIRKFAVSRFSTKVVAKQYERYFERLLTLWDGAWFEN